MAQESKIEQKYEEAQKDISFSEEEMNEKGITIKWGMPFDKDGNMINMSKKDLQRLFMEQNIRHFNFEEQLRGVLESINNHGEMIKSFHKKLAHNKTDIQIIMERRKTEIQTMIGNFKHDMHDLEDMVTKRSSMPIAPDSVMSTLPHDSAKDSHNRTYDSQ